MVTTFFYSVLSPDTPAGLKSFSLTVRSESHDGQAFDLMLSRAKEEAINVIASNTGMDGEPVLVGYAGIPDLQVILRRGAVAAVFWRNSKLPPCVVVSDLDYADNEEEAISHLSVSLNERGFQRLPHMEELPSPE